MANAAVDRVPEPCLSLITNRNHRVGPLVHRDVVEELRDVASSEHLVHRREMSGALLRVEIRRKYAPRHTLPSQELACPAWPSTTAAAAAASTASGSRHATARKT